jgi:NitT/TauT family transport system substrate-binding protein
MFNYTRGKIICVFLSVILLAVLIMSGCSRTQKNSPAGKLEPLKLGVLPMEDNFPFFVAQADGMFTKAGLPAELISFNSARERDLALQAGEIDGEVADIVAAALLKKAGTPVKIVSLTMGSTPREGRFVLLAAPDSGIDQPADLKGVKVAVSEHTIIDYVNYRLLAIAGLRPEEITTVNIPAIPARLQLLLAGQVKAAVLPDPLATLAEKKGAKVILDDTQINENISQVVLLFREEVIENKASSITALLDVFGDASALVTSNPQKYRGLFIEKARLPEELKDTYLTPRYSQPALPGPDEVQLVMNWMVTEKLIPNAYSYQEITDSQFTRGGS